MVHAGQMQGVRYIYYCAICLMAVHMHTIIYNYNTHTCTIQTGIYKVGVPREERLCMECERNEEVEDCNHWVLRGLLGGSQKDGIF